MTAPRDALLDAAYRLSEHVKFDALTADMIPAEAKMPADTFIGLFVDLPNYLIALQDRHSTEMRGFITGKTANCPSGQSRLRAGAIAYLDESLRKQGLRGWLLAARHSIPLVAESQRRMNETLSMGLSVEFAADQWPAPIPAARIFLAIAQETARFEHAAKGPLPEMREALFHFFKVRPTT